MKYCLPWNHKLIRINRIEDVIIYKCAICGKRTAQAVKK